MGEVMKTAGIAILRDHHRVNESQVVGEVTDSGFRKYATDEHAIVSATDAQGRIIDANEEFARVSGYSREEILGNTHRFLRSGLHDDSFYRDLWETISSGDVWKGTMCNRSRDGGLCWVETTIVPRLDGDGRPVEYLAICTDVSEKVLAERQVAWLARLPEESPTPVMRLSRSAKVLYANQAAAQLLMDLRQVHFEWLNNTWPVKIARALEMGDNDEFELKSGERYYHFQLAPICAEDYVNVYVHDITERRVAERRLSYQARHDALTGLVNRTEFEQMLDRVIEDVQAGDRQGLLLYLDLDQFKVVNDTCGHVAGDELLRQLAAELSRHVRGNDVLARLGGDEFAVLLRNCPLNVGLEIGEKLRAAVTEFQFVWDNRSFRVGVSIGAVVVDAQSEGRDEVMAAADVACYAAKDGGRNRLHLYQLEDDDAARKRTEMHWAGRIPQALADDRFVLMAQAVAPLRAASSQPGHYEVLLRMLDEDGEMIPPGAFIPAAERYDLMPSIDHWVIQQVFQVLEQVRSQGLNLSHWRFAINLCGPSLGNQALIELISREIERLELPEGQLSFEITETAAISNLTEAVGFIQQLKHLGCQVALDDFGSGLSSFAYLKNLPVDYLKIDGAFVRDMLNDPIDAAMVEAINRIGHVMHIRTIAEFVETKAVRQRLAEMGVDFGQGFAIAKPRSLNELLEQASLCECDVNASHCSG